MASPTTTKEALQMQMLEDVDALLTRLEKLQVDLARDIAEATQDATGKALLAARLGFEESISKQRHEIIEAGQQAAREIKSALSTPTAVAITPHGKLKHGLLRIAIILAAGFAGGAGVLLLVR